MNPSCLTTFILAAVMIVGAAPARAQSDNDLRRENQRLQSEVDTLTRELEAARERIDNLQQEIDQLKEQMQKDNSPRRGAGGAGGFGSTQADAEKVSIDESSPDASPRALLAALQESYQKQFEEIDYETREQRRRYLEMLEEWASSSVRKFRKPVDWVVLINEGRRDGRVYQLQVTAIDPQTNVALGDSFSIELPVSKARALENYRNVSINEIPPMRVHGTAQPIVRINEDRETVGAFNNPKLIGPFAEFDLKVNVKSLIPWSPEEEDENTDDRDGRKRPSDGKSEPRRQR